MKAVKQILIPFAVILVFAHCTKDRLPGSCPATGTTSTEMPTLGRPYPTSCTTPTVLVSWFAGSGTAGYYDAPKHHAQMTPYSLAQDAAGNIYFTDYNNHAIRKIKLDGTVVTVAGGSTPGFVNGTGAAARFNRPFGIDIDNLGNVIVADAGNNAIRKVTPSGVVTTIAGGPGAGMVDGLIPVAKFNYPRSVSVDMVNNDIYVADYGNGRIRKVKQLSKVWTVAGGGTAMDGPALNVDLLAIQDIDFNSVTTELLIADAGKIRSLVSGYITNIYALSYAPVGIKMDANSNIYIVVRGDIAEPYQVKRIIRSSGRVNLLGGGTAGYGGYVNGNELVSRFRSPQHLIVNSDGGLLYVADAGNNMIRQIDVSCD